MTTSEKGDIAALRQQFADFLGTYEKDRTMNQETHDAVIELKVELKNCKQDIGKHDTDINELKSKPGKKWESSVMAFIMGVIGVIVGALSRFFDGK